MSVYTKLNHARTQFHALKLEKTGHNKFAGYKYFELGDFLIPALKVFGDLGLCAVVSFSKELATMTIIDVEDNSKVEITSPLSTAALKGCHEIQNVGACETYSRRYLWVAALEIVEHDALDATTGSDAPKTYAHKPTALAKGDMTDKQHAFVAKIAAAIAGKFGAGEDWGGYEEMTSAIDLVKSGNGDHNQFKTALFDVLDSKTRSAIKSMEASATKETV